MRLGVSAPVFLRRASHEGWLQRQLRRRRALTLSFSRTRSRTQWTRFQFESRYRRCKRESDLTVVFSLRSRGEPNFRTRSSSIFSVFLPRSFSLSVFLVRNVNPHIYPRIRPFVLNACKFSDPNTHREIAAGGVRDVTWHERHAYISRRENVRPGT